MATHLVQAGVSLAYVRLLLGHVRLDTTQRYVVVEREDLRRAVEVLERKKALGRGTRLWEANVQGLNQLLVRTLACKQLW